MLFEQGFETRKTEHFMLGVMGLHQAVSIEEEALSRCDGDFMLIVAGTGHHSKRHACCPEFRDATLLTSIRQVMSCIGISHEPTCWIENGIETGDKHHGRDFCIEQFVDSCEYLAWRSCPLGCGTKHSAGGCHHQGCRDTFTGDITNDKTQSTVFKLEEIV